MPALQDSIDAIRIAAAAADRMKATDIVAFDVTEPLAITDAMLIASASNERQVLAVAEEIEKDLYLKAGKRQPRSREGLTEGQWVLLDYGDFVIHVMHHRNVPARKSRGRHVLVCAVPAIRIRRQTGNKSERQPADRGEACPETSNSTMMRP